MPLQIFSSVRFLLLTAKNRDTLLHDCIMLTKSSVHPLHGVHMFNLMIPERGVQPGIFGSLSRCFPCRRRLWPSLFSDQLLSLFLPPGPVVVSSLHPSLAPSVLGRLLLFTLEFIFFGLIVLNLLLVDKVRLEMLLWDVPVAYFSRL